MREPCRGQEGLVCRLTMVAIASERTIAAAAHAADFADAAHLTRTFYQMVGMAPSVLMRGDFIEIPSPFTMLPQETGGR